MCLDRFQARQPRPTGWAARQPPRGVLAGAAVLVILARGEAAGNPPVEEDRPVATAADANPDTAATEAVAEQAPSEARMGGSLTLRYGAREGAGNDRMSARLGVDWELRHWSGGISALLENTILDDAIHVEEGVGSFELSERWIGWARDLGRTNVDLRLGTAHGLRFGEGLVLGAPSFDGIQLQVSPGPRLRLIALAGRTDVIDPEDFFAEPIGLFPIDDEFLGKRGSLAAVRAELGDDGMLMGWSLVDARADGLPTARLLSADLAFHRGRVDFSGEAGVRDGGGTALFARTDVSLADGLTLGIERRQYRDFASPLGNAPLYTGLSSSSERDEDGWLLRMDFAPTERVSGTWSADYSKGLDSSGKREVKLDHRLALNFALTEKTAVAVGFEYEDVRLGIDGQVHSLLLTHSFDGGARLAARLSVDRSTPGTDTTLRLAWRRPIANRRLTLLVDDSIRSSGGSIENSLVLGTSVRLGTSSQLTVRATMADAEPNSLDVSWYRRF